MDECSSSSPSMTTRVSLRVISALIIRTEFIQCSGANFQPQLKGSWEVEGADASCLTARFRRGTRGALSPTRAEYCTVARVFIRNVG
jgi:hypothetical protein